jgi:acetyl-CoA acyltransferase
MNSSLSEVRPTGVCPECLGLTVVASITASVAAADGTGSLTGHIAAIHRALTAAGIAAAALAGAQVDETFAATALAWQCALQVHPELINPTGGALALGNAPGATPIGQLAELLALPLGADRGRVILSTANPDGTGVATILQAS